MRQSISKCHDCKFYDTDARMCRDPQGPAFTPNASAGCSDGEPKSTAELTAEANAKGEGFKADAGKLDWTLFPFDGAEEVVRVLERGAEKYARDNWRSVPDGINRYRKAGLRHRIADALGEANDPETGHSHLAHSVCCDLFVLALLRAEKKP
jgi:hypothetical protein